MKEGIEYYTIGKKGGKIYIYTFPMKALVGTFENEELYKDFMETIETKGRDNI